MTLDVLRQTYRDEVLAAAARHGAGNVRVFGSVARGEPGAQSDLDLLVDLAPGRTLMDLGGLLMELQTRFDVRVDLATERMLRPEIRQRVLADAVPL